MQDVCVHLFYKICFFIPKSFAQNCIAKKCSLQDRHCHVFLCTSELYHFEVHSSLQTYLVCSHGQQFVWWQRSLDWAAPSLLSMLSTAPQPSKQCLPGLLPCTMTHRQTQWSKWQASQRGLPSWKEHQHWERTTTVTVPSERCLLCSS